MRSSRSVFRRLGWSLFFALAAGAAWAQTTVPGGTISTDTTWTAAGSPYTVTGNVTVQGTDGADSVTSLTIEPGVTVQFNTGFGLTIGNSAPGALIVAAGAGTEPVLTSSAGTPAAGDWNGLTMGPQCSAAVTSVNYLKIEYAGRDAGAGFQAALTFSGNSVTFQNLTVTNSQETGILFQSASTATVTTAAVSTTGQAGVEINGASPVLSGFTVTGAGTNGFRILGSAGGSVSTSTVVNPASYGIRYAGAGNTTFNNCTNIDKNFTFDTGNSASTAAITNSTLNNFNAWPPSIPLDVVGRVLPGNTFTGVLAGATVTILEGTTITRDATWPGKLAGIPLSYAMLGAMATIQGTDGGDSVTTLTIQQAATLRFPPGNFGLDVGNGAAITGALVVTGTVAEPVIMTTSSGTPAAGDWYGVNLSATANASVTNIAYLTVRYAGRSRFGSSNDACVRVSSGGTLANVTAQNSANNGFFVSAGNASLTNLTVSSGMAVDGIRIGGGSATLTDASVGAVPGTNLQITGGTPTIVRGAFSAGGVNGIRVTGTAAPNFTQAATVSGSTAAAVYGSSSAAWTLRATITTPGTYGVELVSSPATIADSSITGGTNGVFATTSNCTITNTSIISPTGYGISFSGATSATLSSNPRLDHGFTFDNSAGTSTFTSNSIRDFTAWPPQVGASDVHSLVNGGNTFVGVTAGAPVNVLGDTIATDATWVTTLAATQVSYKVVSGIVIVQGTDGADLVTTLTLPAGSVMKFNTATGLDIAPSTTPGALIANGTAILPILLTSAQAVKARGDWYGLFLGPGNREDVSVINYLTAEYAGADRFTGRDGVLRVDGDAFGGAQLITNCTFRESALAGIAIFDSGPILQNCNISACTEMGAFFDNATATLDTCSISNTTLHGIWFGPNASNCTFTNCTIDGGIYYATGATTNTFSGNAFTGMSKNTNRIGAGAVSGIMSEGGNTVEDCGGAVLSDIIGGTISNDALWPGNLCGTPAVYQLVDDGASTDITVAGTSGPDSCTTWTVEAGATIRVQAGANLAINIGTNSVAGAVVFNGTAAQPILITSAAVTKARGDWQGLLLDDGNNPAVTKFDYVTIEYGGGNRFGITWDADLRLDNTSATLNNCIVRESANHGIAVYYGSLNLNGTQIYNNSGDAIYSQFATITGTSLNAHDMGGYGVRGYNTNLTLASSSVTNLGNYGLYFTGTGNMTLTGCTVHNSLYAAAGAMTVTSSSFSNLGSYPPTLPANAIGPLLSSGGNTFTGATANMSVGVGSEVISTDATWPATLSGQPIRYDLAGPVAVNGTSGPDAVTTLTLAAGATLRFASGGYMNVGDANLPGALVAVGTAGSPVVLTGQTASRGSWAGLRFYDDTSTAITNLDYLQIHYGGSFTAALYITAVNLAANHLTITESGSDGIEVNGSQLTLANLTINGVNEIGIYSSSGGVNLAGASIANCGRQGFYSYNGGGTISSLTVTSPNLSAGGYYGFHTDSTSNFTVSGSTIANSLRITAAGGANAFTGTVFNNVGAFPPMFPANETGVLLGTGGNTFNNVTAGTVVSLVPEDVTRDQTWPATIGGQPIVYNAGNGYISVRGTDGVDSVTALTIAPGVTVKFNAGGCCGTRLEVGQGAPGALIANGTAGQPIVFTSVAGAPAAGDWEGLRFYGYTASTLTSMSYVTVEYAGANNNAGAVRLEYVPGMTMSNLTIRNNLNYGFEGSYSNFSLTNSTIYNNAEYGVYLYGNPTGTAPTGTFTGVSVYANGWHQIYAETGAKPTFNNVTVSAVPNGYYGMYFNNTVYVTANNCNVAHGVTWTSAAGANTISNSTFGDFSSYPPSLPANEVGRTLFTGGNTFNNVVAGDKVTVLGEDIADDATWPATLSGVAVRYLLSGDNHVRGSSGPDHVTTLTLQPGATLRFAASAGLIIGNGAPGALNATGTAGQPILFTSDAAVPAAGDWKGLEFNSQSNSILSNLAWSTIEYAGSTSGPDVSLYLYYATLNVSDTTIRYGNYYGIWLDRSYLYATNLTVQNTSRTGVVAVYAEVQATGMTISGTGYEGFYASNSSGTLSGVNITNPGTTYYGFFFDSSSNFILDNCSADHAFSFNSTSGANAITNCTFRHLSTFPPSIPANEVGTALFSGGNTYQNAAAGNDVFILAETVANDATWGKTVGGQPVDLVMTSGSLYVAGLDGADYVTTLTIQPGAVLRFGSGANIQVGYSDPGALYAVGTAGERILFTSSSPTPAAGNWDNVRFYGGASPVLSRMSYCTMEYGGRSASYLLYAEYMALNVDHMLFRYSAGEAIYTYNATLTLTDSEIHNTAESGIYGYNSTLNVDPTWIHDTTQGGIRADYCTVNLDQVTITNVGNTYYGLYFGYTSNATVTNCIVEHGFTFDSTSGFNSMTGTTIKDFTNYLPSIPADEVGQMLFSGGNTFQNVAVGDTVNVLTEYVTRDATWPNALSSTAIRYQVNGEIYIAGYSGADATTTLSLSPGTTVRFAATGALHAGDGSQPGALRAVGTAVQKVLLTSNQASPAAGGWRGLYFHDTSDPALSRLEHCIVEYSGASGWSSVYLYYTGLVTDNLTIRNVQNIGLETYSSTFTGSNLTVASTGSSGVVCAYGSMNINGGTISNTGGAGILSTTNSWNLSNVTITNPAYTSYGMNFTGPGVANTVSIANCTVDHGLTFTGANGANTVTGSTFKDIGTFPPSLPANEVGQILFTGGNTFNGVVYGTPVTVLAETITRDATWPAALSGQAVRYIMPGTAVYVEGTDGADFVTTLTLNPGVTLRFGINGYLYVGSYAAGALSADGLPSAPITFTSAATTPAAGDWGHVMLDSLANEALSVIGDCVFEYGGRSSSRMLRLYFTNLNISNSVFRYSGWDGLGIENSTSQVNSCTFQNIAQSGIYAATATLSVNGSVFASTTNGIATVNTDATIGGSAPLGNDFYANTTNAVMNQTNSRCLDASYNWWNSVSGPNDTNAADDGCMGPVSNASPGQNVTQDVYYAPFATAPVVPPAAPTLNSPANPSMVATLTPNLVVNNSAGTVTHYIFQIAEDMAFSVNTQTSPNITPGGGATSWTVASPLTENRVYYWHAKAVSGAGAGPWSSTWQFFVNTVNDAPNAPTVISPADGAAVGTRTPTLVAGNATDPDDNLVQNQALTYQFYVYSDAGLTTVAASVTGVAEGGSGTTSWTVTPQLAEDTNYWWRVRASDGSAGAWSSVRTFRTNATNSAPTAPVVSSPADGAAVTLTPTLTVTNGTDADGNTLTYEFEIYSDRNLTDLVESMTGVAQGGGTTSYTVTATLEESEIYSWRARTYDGFTWSAFTPASTFRTPGFLLDHAAERGYITGSDTDRPEEVRYRFPGAAGNVTLTYQAYDVDASELAISVNGNPATTIAAQVNGGWSTALQVTLPDAQVNDATENVVTFDNLLSPAALESWGVRNVAVLKPGTPANVVATAYNTTVDITWRPNSDAITTGYNVYYATVNGGPYTQLNGAPLTTNFYRHSGLANGTTYYYIVRAQDASSNLSDPSAQVSGTPSTSVVTPVVDLRVSKVGNDLRLQWTNVTNSPAIVSYRIYRKTNAILLDAEVDAGTYLFATDSSGTGMWTDTGAAADGNNYSYEVRPFDGVTQATD